MVRGLGGEGRGLPEDQRVHSFFSGLTDVFSCNAAAAAAAAKSLQSCPTLRDPIEGIPEAPPSLGFSRQEHWSGLPFPSPVHESDK